MRIHRAGREHLTTVASLLTRQLREHGVEISPSLIEHALIGVLDNPDRGFCLVAVRNEVCIGAAYVSFIWALEHGGHSAWLEELFVEPKHRSAGVGTAMLEAVITECRASGCVALDLEIDREHEQVRSLYERYSFTSLPRSRMVRRLR